MGHNRITGPFQLTEEDIRLDVTLTIKDVGKWYITINWHTQVVRDKEHGKELRDILSKLH